MLSRILEILVFYSIILQHVASAPAVSKARQFIPAIPGFVPVYIRTGDTPLEDINPDLAEAFNSYAQKHARLIFSVDPVRYSKKAHMNLDDTLDKISNVQDLDLEEDNVVNDSNNSVLHKSNHIQKIPRI